MSRRARRVAAAILVVAMLCIPVLAWISGGFSPAETTPTPVASSVSPVADAFCFGEDCQGKDPLAAGCIFSTGGARPVTLASVEVRDSDGPGGGRILATAEEMQDQGPVIGTLSLVSNPACGPDVFWAELDVPGLKTVELFIVDLRVVRQGDAPQLRDHALWYTNRWVMSDMAYLPGQEVRAVIVIFDEDGNVIASAATPYHMSPP